ncbi:LPD29 domain-containing protein [Williamsia sterculiae]|uniref:Large polyvalent protein associated domain-containing protein n=1 Tax=Williamsia sterculiae TaxID=1344003 RepID=A0A1N7HE10_9NOCA|nr:LPD29 domain-containing protein [Williamsia sterculiae]SIS23117.1 hypothetical protein SAMN05445060_4057 [Williamsia sterculiae]
MTVFTTKQTAAEIRKHLRATWPGVKFSVRCDRGTASSWIRVSWTDGPTDQQVRHETHQFQGAQFNGMTDSYDDLGEALVCTNPAELPEVRRYYCDGINTSRDISDPAVVAAAQTIAAENPDIRAAFSIEDIDPAALTYNRLHRDLSTIRLDENRWIKYHGQPVTGRHLPDLGSVISAAVHCTDYTGDTPTVADRH